MMWEKLSKQSAKYHAWIGKKMSGSVQDVIIWQDCRSLEEDLGIRHGDRLNQQCQTVAEKNRCLIGMNSQNCCKA